MSAASNRPSYGVRDDEVRSYDAVLYLSFGGPEGPDDVLPFMENVTSGRGVPRERLLRVSDHYRLFGGVSPINAQNRAVVAALEEELARSGPDIPVYWGNRNWHPYVADALRAMQADGVRRAITFVTSAFSSYSGCRQYREDIASAHAAINGEGPEIDKLRVFYNHPGFIEPQAQNVRIALEALPEERGAAARIAFTAHSIPAAMAETSSYVEQLLEACELVVDRLGTTHEWRLVYQSRSGPQHIPWLEPDISDHIETLAGEGATDLVVVPIGFVSDHMEVRFDLDVEAARTAASLGLNMVRAHTVGAHPLYVRMIRDLIMERTRKAPERFALGSCGASHDVCGAHCCPPPGAMKLAAVAEAAE